MSELKWYYLTGKEVNMSSDDIDLQCVLGLQSCKTKADVLEIFHDIRQHERLQCHR